MKLFGLVFQSDNENIETDWAFLEIITTHTAMYKDTSTYQFAELKASTSTSSKNYLIIAIR